MKVEDWKTKNVTRQAISVARLYQIVNRFKASANKTLYLQHILDLLVNKDDFRWIFSTFLIWPFIHSFAHDAFSFSLDKHPPLSYRRSPVSSWSNWAKRTLVSLQLSKISQPYKTLFKEKSFDNYTKRTLKKPCHENITVLGYCAKVVT